MEYRFIEAEITEENKEEYLAQCGDDTILDAVYSDFEITVLRGYSIQFSATRSNNFAMFYPACSVDPAREFVEKTEFEYDFSFQGDVRPPIRERLFRSLRQQYFAYRPNVKSKIVLNSVQFSMYSEDDRLAINNHHGYESTMRESRFVLCPMGSGLQSIRFYEALAVGSIPIFIGDRKAKFPLDWIIDWDRMCFRIDSGSVENGFYQICLDKCLKLSDREINDRRRYIFEMFREHLTDKAKFKDLILKRLGDLNA